MAIAQQPEHRFAPKEGMIKLGSTALKFLKVMVSAARQIRRQNRPAKKA